MPSVKTKISSPEFKIVIVDANHYKILSNEAKILVEISRIYINAVEIRCTHKARLGLFKNMD
jgi:hypothetical protein